MSRIDTTFQALRRAGRKAFIPYLCAGDPDMATTLQLLHTMVEAGADVIELGIPFSDPMADGPVIQRSSERALQQGVSLRACLALVAEFRQTNTQTPLVLMGYLNPVEAMGYEAFALAAQQAGVDGVLTVDLPPEEAAALVAVLKQRAIAPIFLLAPTTPEHRVQAVAQQASGYIYYVSLKGVTGAANLNLEEVAAKVQQLRQHLPLPIGVGFGIRDGETARAVASVADAVVVGSRIVQEIEQSPKGQVVERVHALVASMRLAIDRAAA